MEWKKFNESSLMTHYVSPTGEIKAVYNSTGRERFPKGTLNNYGYKIIAVRDDETKKQKRLLIHRLVAQAFIPNPENKPTVNHIDGDKFNNAVDNLEWATFSEQMLHANKIGLRHGNS